MEQGIKVVIVPVVLLTSAVEVSTSSSSHAVKWELWDSFLLSILKKGKSEAAKARRCYLVSVFRTCQAGGESLGKRNRFRAQSC